MSPLSTMIGTPASFAMETTGALPSTLCGITTRASTPAARRVSQSLICLFTSPPASYIRSSTPSSFASASAASAIAATNVSELSFDEKPILISALSFSAADTDTLNAPIVAIIETASNPPKTFFFIFASSLKENVIFLISL